MLVEELRAGLSAAQLLSFSRWVSVRARFVEDLVAQASRGGLGQYVILGAGLDSFAYRRRDLLGRMRVFEVDHPATQEWKRNRLRHLQIGVPDELVFAPVDFESETLAEGLARAGLNRKLPTLFSWLGVTMYLSSAAVESTLATIASWPAGTRIVLSYDMPPGVLSGLQLQVRDSLARIVSGLGEPFVTTFEPDDAEALLRSSGFGDIFHFGPSEAVERYFGARRDIAVGGSQRLLTAAVR